MVNSTTFIYALCEPGTRTIRYIGKADNIKNRLKQHRSEARLGVRKNHKDRWLFSLEKAGAKPEIIVISEVLKTDWKGEEMRYIRVARMLGMDLVNGTEGGDGRMMQITTPETRAILSKNRLGSKHTEETKARMSDSRRGENNPNYGKTLSLETRAKISEKNRGKRLGEGNHNFGKPLPAETRAKISAAKLGVANPHTGSPCSVEVRAKIGAGVRAANARKAATT